MASSDETRVFIIAASEGHEKQYRVSSSTTIGELKDRWFQEVNESREEWTFKKNNTIVDDSEKLTDIAEIHEIGKFVTLFVTRVEVPEVTEESERAVMKVKLFGSSSDEKQIEVDLSQTPEKAHEVIRQALDLPVDRLFRLRTDGGPLSYCFPFNQQQVDTDSSLKVEIGFYVETKDIWSETVEKHQIFSFDSLRDICPNETDNDQRIVLGRQVMDLDKNLRSSLPPYMLRETRFRVHVEEQRSVNVYINGKFMHRKIWPSDQVSKIVPKFPRSLNLRYEGESVFAKNTFKEIGLEEGGLICEYVAVAVRLSSGLTQAFWMSKLSTASELKDEVRRFEVDADFEMKCGSRILQPTDAIDDKCISVKMVEVQRCTNEFRVDVSGEMISWISKKGPLSFKQLSAEFMEASNLSWIEVSDFVFCCNGCGRRICLEEEEYQLLPDKCCHLQSLELTLLTPVELKDAVTQGFPKVKTGTNIGTVRTKTFGQRSETQNEECQTERETVSQASQTRARLGGQSFVTQHPPPRIEEPRPFRLRNETDTGSIPRWTSESVSLLLPPDPTTGEVREAVARFLQRKPEETRMEQGVGVFQGRRVVWSWDDRGDRVFFTTEDGGAVKGNVKDRKSVDLHDDAAMVALPPGRRLFLRVLPRRG